MLRLSEAALVSLDLVVTMEEIKATIKGLPNHKAQDQMAFLLL